MGGQLFNCRTDLQWALNNYNYLQMDTQSSRENKLIDICKGLEQLRVDNKASIRQSQIEALRTANMTVVNINKYLLTVATLLVPIIFSFTTIREISRTLNSTDGLLLKISLVFLGASIAFGFIHMFFEVKYYRDWLKNDTSKLKLWSSTSFWPGNQNKAENYVEEYNSIKKEVDNISSEQPGESSNIPILFQGTFWFMALVFLAIVVWHLLP